MKLGIMQPYFFPYPGYFALIHRVDRWIAFDTPQYIRHGWVNRNRIQHPAAGWQYILAPLRKHRRGTPIRNIELAAPQALSDRICAQLTHYRKRAPYYTKTLALVRECLDSPSESLARLNLQVLDRVCAHLGIVFRGEAFSEMDLKLNPGEVRGPGDWALEIATALGASTYVNPPGGREIFDPRRFAARGIELQFEDDPPFIYDCEPYAFQPNLSIVDALMWNEPSAIVAGFDATVEAAWPH